MKRGVLIAALFVVALVGFGFGTTASAGCTLGVKDCRNGQLWVCERCGSETCMIFKGTRCHRDTPPDTFMGVQLEQPTSARLCAGGESAIDRALHGVQVRQPVQARAAAVEIVAVPITAPLFN
jgi:hypothetical protein